MPPAAPRDAAFATRLAHAWPRWCGVGLVALGLAVLAAWWLGVAWLKAPVAGLPAMKANTSMAFVLLGGGLLGLDARGRLRDLATGLAALAALLGGLTLLEHLGLPLRLDEVLVRDDPDALGAPGRMAPLSAVAILLAGVGLTGARSPRHDVAREAFAAVLVFIAAFVLGSYAYGAAQVAQAVKVAPHAAVAFLALGPALLLARRDGPVATFLLSPDLDGQLARRLLPMAFAVPLAVGFVRIQLQDRGLVDTATAAALFAALMVMALAGSGMLLLVRLRRSLQERAAALAAEREAVRRLRQADVEREAFFLHNLDMMAIVDFDGRFREMNPAWQTTLGHPLEAMLGRPFIEFVHPDDAERTLAEAGRLSASGQPVPFENRYRRSDGTYAQLRWTSTVSTQLQVFLATARDVTAEREAQAQAQRATERFRTVFQLSPVPIVLTKEDGAFVDVNDAFCRLVGRAREEMVGGPVRAQDVWEDPQERTRILASLRQGGLVRDLELRVRRPDGEVRVTLASLEFVDVGGGTTILSVLQDITERQKQQHDREERIATEAELERLRRTDRFRTEFINSTAHELATPLTPLVFNVHALSTDPGLSPQQRRLVESMDRNVRRLRHLVDDMVGAADLQARSIALDRRRLNLTRELRAAVASHQAAAERAGLALTDGDDAAATVSADPARLQLVLGHLLGNAIKFTPAGGRVSVGSRRLGDTVRVEVVDSGAGLTRTQMEGLFRPFAQAHDKAQRTDSGSGLGLYIAKGVIELHGGEIGVSSPGPGQGSTFWFTLPLAPGHVDPLAKPAREPDAPSGPRRDLNPGVADDPP